MGKTVIDSNITKYAMVFDMDETLGYFTQLYDLWNVTSELLNIRFDSEIFFNFIDALPLVLRPKIMVILNLIKDYKKQGLCDYVMIYTNNNGPPEWGNLIKKYFNFKLDYKLFDQIIGAFKVDNKIIEICRTSNKKSYDDILSCTKLPKNTQMCFIDDIYHKNMYHENVFYIKIEPYIHIYNYKNMAELCYNKNEKMFNKIISKNEYINIIFHNMKNIYSFKEKKNVQKNIEFILGDIIIKKIHKFFNNQKNQKKQTKLTKKQNVKINKRNVTKKRLV
jgi:hypothetical protein